MNTQPPTAVNQIWQMVAAEGLVWGIEGAALPLLPGQTLTLTIGDAYYFSSVSVFSGVLAPGTAVYAQVDSANAGWQMAHTTTSLARCWRPKII